MCQVSASEAGRDFAQIMDTAQKEPVVVRKNDRDYVAIVSMEDYADLVQIRNERLIKMAREIATEAQKNGLTPEILADISNQ